MFVDYSLSSRRYRKKAEYLSKYQVSQVNERLETPIQYLMKYLILTSIVFLVVAPFAYTQSKPVLLTTSRPLMVYSPHGAEILQLVRKELRKRHPTAKMDWVYLGAEQLGSKLRSEKFRPIADIWWGGPQAGFINAKKGGLLAKYSPSWAANVDSGTRDSENFWHGDMQTPLTIFTNDKSNALGDLKDWDDLLKAKFKNKIGARFPLDSGSMRSLYQALIDRQIRKGRSLDDALAWMARLENNIGQYFPHSTHMFRSIGKGVFDIGFWNLSEVGMRKGQGFPISYVLPESGVPVLLDCIALVKRPDVHPLAEEFFEIVTSKEIANQLSQPPFNRIMVRKDFGGSQPDYMQNTKFKVMETDWDRISREGMGWLRKWKDSVLSTRKVAH